MLLKQIEKKQMELKELKEEKEKFKSIEKRQMDALYNKKVRETKDNEKFKKELLEQIKVYDNKIKILDKKIDFLQLLILQLQDNYNKNVSKDILNILIKNYEKIKETPLRYKKFTKLLDNYKNCYLSNSCITVNNFNENTENYFYISDNTYFEEKYIFSLENLQNLYDKIIIVDSLEQIKKIETMVQETLDFENEIKENIKNLKDKNDKKRKELKDNNLNYLQNHLYDNLQNEKKYL